MASRKDRWTKKEVRRQLDVVRSEVAPTKVLKNAVYLNSARKVWSEAHIWISGDRIAYVGSELPKNMDETEVIDCSGKVVVPGYMEHHVHPFQLYNPLSFAEYASARGTTTLLSDNLFYFLNLEKKKALTLIEELDRFPASMYWWARLDPQTELKHENYLFAPSQMKAWLEHPLVLQAGEMTAWPKMLTGDDTLLHWMLEARREYKPIEGHLPGASEKTLAQMVLTGVTADHEAMTGEEVIRRLDAGLVTSLRHSSIRPDLRRLLREIQEAEINDYSRLLLNTDGSTPAFYEDGVMDALIKIALEEGVPPIAAYEMASYNPARYYGIDDTHGLIAPGRIAHLNILSSVEEPQPEAVLAKGAWVHGPAANNSFPAAFPWEDFGVQPSRFDWDVQDEDFHFSMPLGIELVNSVILKPYQVATDVTQDRMPAGRNESFFVMIDKHGHWRINTLIKGFDTDIEGFATTFSNTGDVVLIGKCKEEMKRAFQRLKELGGGMVLAEQSDVVYELPLPLFGIMADQFMEDVIAKHKALNELLKERGYPHDDPVYSLLFFASTHLPYIRVTQEGIYDVHKKTVLFPSIMR
ncbi:adenine deaminase [Salsuginibacillus halophilus]|uniref:adenine deaminase n=1 Tax=Salsuginibacillus halophilus TaxID=517424 RepID=A0A2P8HLF6_9BACI|nr:adenine deaminase C-terminal domain-containing protein [Salsuginibacillus halophilus]PSL47047.1 adenine deaminase [Salsuginibacillus halophilus]